MPDKTANWGVPGSGARYRTQDSDPSGGGNFVVAQRLDSNGDPEDVLLEWDETAGEWVYGGPVNLDGSDLTNVGALDADSVSTGEGLFKGHPWADVTAYGADPSGSNDSTQAFKDALQNNIWIFVPPGDYLISEDITVGDGNTLLGASRTHSTIELTNGATISLGGRRIYLGRLQIKRGDSNGGDAITYQNGTVRRSVIDHVWILNDHDIGINFGDDNWTNTVKDTLIQNCTEHATYAGSNHINVRYHNVEALSNENGFRVAGSGQAIAFFGCRSEDNTGSGFDLRPLASQVLLCGCMIESNDKGVEFEWNDPETGESGTVVGCSFYGNTSHIIAGTWRKITLIGNRFAGASDTGIETSSTSLNAGEYQVHEIDSNWDTEPTTKYAGDRDLVYREDIHKLHGPDTERPSDAGTGETYYNSTAEQLEVYTGSEFVVSDGSTT